MADDLVELLQKPTSDSYEVAADVMAHLKHLFEDLQVVVLLGLADAEGVEAEAEFGEEELQALDVGFVGL